MIRSGHNPQRYDGYATRPRESSDGASDYAYGEVTRKQFNSLCDNRRPDNGEKLNPREDADRKVGYDMTFSAPKSVSIVYEILGDERILEIFQKSVRETMESIERDAHVRVRRGGEVSQRRTGNLVWAEYTHHISRPVEGLSDPNLHSHCYCFNTSFDVEESRFKAGEFFLSNTTPLITKPFFTASWRWACDG